MTYNRIRRGPMAADQFTQIRNALFRDPRLSLKDKGLFGLISTHRDGWGVTPESLATCCTDGVSSIKSGLRNLERYGYLRRDRERRKDGTLGSSAYYITDEPAAVIEQVSEELRRSEPEGDYPPVVEPPVAEPTVVDRAHKKTIPQNINSKNTPSPSRPPLELVPSTAEDQGGGGGGAPQQGKNRDAAAAFVDRLPYGARLPGPRQRDHLIAAVAAAFAAGWPEWQLRVQLTEETDSAKSLAAVYQHRLAPENLPAAPPAAKPVAVPSAGGDTRPRCSRCTSLIRKSADVSDDLCKECREGSSAGVPAPRPMPVADPVQGAALARGGMVEKALRPRR